MKKIYFGAPLFSKSEQMFNDFVANKIDELNKFKIYVPQRNETINDKRYNKDILKNIKEETKEDLKYFSNDKDNMYNPFKDLLNK